MNRRGLARLPFVDDRPVVEQDDAIAHAKDQVGRVGHEHDRPPLLLERADPLQALGLECDVADGEHLVNEQDRRVHVHRDGEAEPHVHPRGVELDLVVDELLELSERDDVVEPPVDLAP